MHKILNSAAMFFHFFIIKKRDNSEFILFIPALFIHPSTVILKKKVFSKI